MKIAIITPYYRETETVLRRCLDSVQRQTHTDYVHYMVADGYPRPDILKDYPRTVAVNLPTAHGDYGCTPRSVGSILALNEGAEVACFLDADNLLTPDHLESLVSTYRAAASQGHVLNAVFAMRHLFVPRHEHLRLVSPEDTAHHHVDTSCISLHRSAAFLWPQWGLIPRDATPVCDRVMFDLIRSHHLLVAWTERFTVLYESNWSHSYIQAGLPIPAEGLHDGTLSSVKFPPDEMLARLRLRIDRQASGA